MAARGDRLGVQDFRSEICSVRPHNGAEIDVYPTEQFVVAGNGLEDRTPQLGAEIDVPDAAVAETEAHHVLVEHLDARDGHDLVRG